MRGKKTGSWLCLESAEHFLKLQWHTSDEWRRENIENDSRENICCCGWSASQIPRMKAGHICSAVLLPSADSVPAGVYLFVKVTMSEICKLFVPLVVCCSVWVHKCMHVICMGVSVCGLWSRVYPGKSKSICFPRIKMPETRKKEGFCSKRGRGTRKSQTHAAITPNLSSCCLSCFQMFTN